MPRVGSTSMNFISGKIFPWELPANYISGIASVQNNKLTYIILKLPDSSGINTTGTGIGHNIIVILDDNDRKNFILNDFYQGDLDSYQSGVIRFQLPSLEPGSHKLKKAWDILNNSNENSFNFIVAADEALVINNVLNYPNPF